MSRPIILDCDPGHDDAMAILLARGCPDIDLRAITTVAGNQTLDKTTLNARRVCTVANIHDVPIYAGCDRPLIRPQIVAGDIHGSSGLDGPVFGEPTVDVAGEHAVDFLVRTLMASDGEITLVPVGPLTNIAMALRREPRIAEYTREVVLMGGSFGRGNRTPTAEFNILADPEAAQVVFGAGWPVTMVGLDLTHQAGASQQMIEEIRSMGTALSRMVVDMLEFYGSTYRSVEGMGDPPVHDPCAVARVARPALVEVADAFVAIETRGEWTSGMTATDFRGKLGHEPNAQVATRLDRDGFWSLMLDAIRTLGADS
jgi:purine nucleosidase/pyrimidine-specific ribonucleoside hydrolase